MALSLLPTTDSSKLQRWAEHFANCDVEVSQASMDSLPVISPPIQSLDSDDLCVRLSEEQIVNAISQMRCGGLLAQMVSLQR